MEKRHKFSMWYVLLGVWVVLIVHNVLVSAFSIRTIPYSEFLQLLKENQVSEVAITANQIQGKKKGGGDEDQQAQLFRTVRVDPNLAELLQEYDVTFKGQIESTFIRDLLSWIIPIFVFIGIWLFIMKRMQGQQPGFMTFGKNKAKLYSEDEVSVTFEDVAGVDESRQELMEVVEFLDEPWKFTDLGGKIPRGILLVGPPGTGKTLLAKAVAGESKVPFFSLSGAEFVEMFVGVGAARVRDLFTQAKAKAPCIIFIDELDALGKARGLAPTGGHDEREQTLNQLLVEMDGFESNEGVILISATNRPDVLDPALLRPGRFDRQVVVSMPDIKGREKILKVHMKKSPVAPDVNPLVLAKGTPGFSGADLENLVNEAALLAAKRDKEKVEMVDFEESKDKVYMGLERKSKVIKEEDRKITAYHEGGHAVVARFLPETDAVNKITIVPRGRAAGVTWFLPEERDFRYKDQLEAELAIAFGGRVAEEIIFNRISTGASNDIERATELARNMVTKWGLSERLGPLMYGEEEEEVFLGRSVTQHKNVSDETAHDIDKEIRSIIDRSYKRAKDILEANLDKLHMMADALMKYETIDSSQIDDIMAGKPPGPPADWDDSAPTAGSGDSRGASSADESPDSKIRGPAGQH